LKRSVIELKRGAYNAKNQSPSRRYLRRAARGVGVMPEGYIIDWTVVAALFATTAAFVAAAVTYFSNKRRHDLDARIEICKYSM